MRRRRTSHSPKVKIRIIVPSPLLPRRRIRRIVIPVRRRVQPQLRPQEQPVVQTPAQHDIVREGVVVRGGGVAGEPVAQVRGVGDGVGAVGRGGLDGVAQGLVEEQLAEVGDGAAGVGAVGEDARADVRDQVLVRRAPLVVAREDGVEADDAVAVRDLRPAQVRRAEPALAARAHAAVGPRRVARPRVDQQPRPRPRPRRRARLHVDELQLEVQRHAGGALDDVAADPLLVHEVRPVGVVGREHAARVRAEDVGDGRVLVEVDGPCLVVRLRCPFLQGGGVAAVEPGGCGGREGWVRRRFWRAGYAGGHGNVAYRSQCSFPDEVVRMSLRVERLEMLS